jgi:hypothetical protein
VHSVIAELAATGEPVDADRVLAAVVQRWAAAPLGGSIASSVRARCSTTVAVYFARFAPPPHDWRLVGSELRVGSAVADLVWRSDRHGVVIDEVKSGVADARDADTADQLRRLAEGGGATFADFVGVRLVPLGSPNRMTVTTLTDGRLVEAPAPEGMALR